MPERPWSEVTAPDRERLRKVLRVFGSHGPRCHMLIAGQYQEPPDYTCTCGLDAMLARPAMQLPADQRRRAGGD